jgi:hypothetical protein
MSYRIGDNSLGITAFHPWLFDMDTGFIIEILVQAIEEKDQELLGILL